MEDPLAELDVSGCELKEGVEDSGELLAQQRVREFVFSDLVVVLSPVFL